MTAPRRRWSFGLRTLFVVVTVLALPLGWLGCQLQIVRERKAVIAEIERLREPFDWTPWRPVKGKPFQRPFEGKPAVVMLKNEDFLGGELPEYARVSWIRRLLGDSSCDELSIPSSVGPQWIERAERAFPEADLSWRSDSDFCNRDSLYKPAARRQKNVGTIFKTGLIEK